MYLKLKHGIRDVISFVLYLFIVWTKRRGAVVLVYHSVDRVDHSKDPYRLSITPERFEDHLKIISKGGDDIIITFDDGYGNNFEHAFPLLKKYKCQATIFLITDYIDGKLESQKFCGENLDLRPLTWEEIRLMDCSGIRFGSHSRTHPALIELSHDAVKEELLNSKKRIELELGHAIDGLAYPFGSRSSFDLNVKEIAKETGYKYAYTNIMGINKGGSQDNYSLKRVRIYSEDGPFKLKMKMAGAYDWIDI